MWFFKKYNIQHVYNKKFSLNIIIYIVSWCSNVTNNRFNRLTISLSWYIIKLQVYFYYSSYPSVENPERKCKRWIRLAVRSTEFNWNNAFWQSIQNTYSERSSMDGTRSKNHSAAVSTLLAWFCPTRLRFRYCKTLHWIWEKLKI